MAGLLDCSRRTVERGLNELDGLPSDPALGRVRRPGCVEKGVESEPGLWDDPISVLEARAAALKAEYLPAGNPVPSVDTAVKEHPGQLYRGGRVRSWETFRAFAHEFPSRATGVIAPHGIYDLARNCGHLNIGPSQDTSAFVCDGFRWYCNRIGRRCPSTATSIPWSCDCGGGNAAGQCHF